MDHKRTIINGESYHGNTDSGSMVRFIADAIVREGGRVLKEGKSNTVAMTVNGRDVNIEKFIYGLAESIEYEMDTKYNKAIDETKRCVSNALIEIVEKGVEESRRRIY